jgi:CubicO group peptidase (beta-lactamase class C family)
VGPLLLVARHGRIVLHEPLGWRHHGDRLPMENHTLFRLASNTKPVIATAILLLEQEGRVRLHDTVASHLPSFDNARSREMGIVFTQSPGGSNPVSEFRRHVTDACR